VVRASGLSAAADAGQTPAPQRCEQHDLSTVDTTTPDEVDAPIGESLTPVGGWLRFKFQCARGASYAALKLFGPRGLYRCAAGFALLEWLINYKRRRRFAAQMRSMFAEALSPAQRRYACRRWFINTRCDKLFYLIFDRLPRRILSERFVYDGVAPLESALRGGSGVYVMLSHFGAQHIAGLVMALRGHKVAGVRRDEEGAIRRYVEEKYARTYPEFASMKVFYSHTFPREIFRALRSGYLLGSASDVFQIANPRLRTVSVRYFGEQRAFLVGPLQAALRCGVPIYQGFVVSEPHFRYRLIARGPLIEAAPDSETPERLAAVMQTYADNIEAMLRKHPCHVTRV
jgi:lauroyl/myristoyl acyltransferase